MSLKTKVNVSSKVIPQEDLFYSLSNGTFIRKHGVKLELNVSDEAHQWPLSKLLVKAPLKISAISNVTIAMLF